LHALNFLFPYLLVLFALVLGCGRAPEVPFDNRVLDIMTRTAIDSADVLFEDGTFFACRTESEIMLFRSLMSSLLPIESHETGILDERDFQLTFFGGKEPGEILVRVGSENRLHYQWGNYRYTGGDALEFRKSIAKMKAIQKTRMDR
jgi:hypothetical protein